MPTYEYLCQACGTRFEVWQKMSDDALTTCQACGGPVRRVLYPAGIVFKGGGFYSTDHRSNGATAAHGGAPQNDAATSDGAKAPAAGGAATADAKGATATPATPASGSGTPSSTPTSGN